MKVTIDDVAREAGVSLATVSRALRGLPNVAPATRAKVREVAERLDYHPDPTAANLAAGATRTVGLLAEGVDTWYASHVLGGIEKTLSAAGYDLLLRTVIRDHPTALVDRARSLFKRVDALLLVDMHLAEEEEEALAESFEVVVTLGSRTRSFDSVMVDNRQAALVIARHLLRLGHRSIATVGGDPDLHVEHTAGFERTAGFRDGLAEEGLVLAGEDHGGFTTDGGLEAGLRLLSTSHPPSAIFAFSDEMAFGVLRAARQLGIHVPGELSVAGFDDHDLAGLLDLTTVRQDVLEQGSLAGRRVLARLGGGGPPVHDLVPTTLVVRGSTGPA